MLIKWLVWTGWKPLLWRPPPQPRNNKMAAYFVSLWLTSRGGVAMTLLYTFSVLSATFRQLYIFLIRLWVSNASKISPVLLKWSAFSKPWNNAVGKKKINMRERNNQRGSTNKINERERERDDQKSSSNKKKHKKKKRLICLGWGRKEVRLDMKFLVTNALSWDSDQSILFKIQMSDYLLIYVQMNSTLM